LGEHPAVPLLVLIELPSNNEHCGAAQIILNHDLEGMKVVLPKATRNFYVGMHNAPAAI
jgi:hypothetical protein